MYSQGRRIKNKALSVCKCDHPHITHYTKDGHCAFSGCGCLEFKSKGNPNFINKHAKCEYGHSHDSGLEIKVCFDLHCLKLAREIRDYTFHKVLDLKGPSGATIATYEIDFIVYGNDETTEFIECKGQHLLREPVWRLKWELLRDMYKGNAKYKFRVITD